MRARQFGWFLSGRKSSYRRRCKHIGLSLLLIMGQFTLGGAHEAASSPARPLTLPDTARSAQAPVCPASIGFGEIIECSISAPGEVDTYSFTASAGDTVFVRMGRSSGNLYPGIRVYGPGGVEVCAEMNSPITSKAEIDDCSLAAGGTYSIEASDTLYGVRTGGYYLYLQRLNNPGGAVPFAFGYTLPGSILTPAQVDTYSFTANPGDTVLVRMGRSSGDLHPGIRVYDSSAAKVCEAINSPVTTKAETGGCILGGGGTYSILVFDDNYGTRTGGYNLFLQRLNNPGNAVAFAFGHTLPGSILTPAQEDTYTFTASAGDVVMARMGRSSGDIHPGIRVYNPSGVKVCEAINSPVTTRAEIGGCSLAAGGTYSILVFDDYLATRTGGYGVFLQRLNNPGNAVPIAFGQTLTGSISIPAQAGSYTFAASAGDKVLVRMGRSSGDFHPGMRVYDPSGGKVCEAIDSPVTTRAEIGSCALAVGGTYSILGFDDYLATRTGGYGVFLQRLNNTGSAVPIAFGQTLPGSILTAAQAGTYTFTASAGDVVLVRMGRSSGDFHPGLRVYGPSGAKVCEAIDSPVTTRAVIAGCSLAVGGSYSILGFDDYLATRTGGYYVYLQRLNNPGNAIPILRGTVRAGTIATPAQADTYTFTVTTANDQVALRLRRESGTLQPGLRVYGPDGTKLCEADATGSAEIASCDLPWAGAYTILAFDSYYATYTGSYKLYLDCCRIFLPLALKTQ